jgi:aspartate/methionine/tyrosine aminotransferase
MFSRRLDWSLPVNRLSHVIAQTGPPAFDLTASNPTRAGLHYPVEMLAALTSPEAMIYQPDARGLAQIRAAIGLPEASLLAASTSELYGFLFKLLCNPGDSVLVPRPSYPLFDFLAQLEGIQVRQYPLHYSEGWWLDLDYLRGALTPSTRAILFVHPNNPTGSYLKRAEQDALAALCAERDMALISDEVFADYPLIEDQSRVETLHGNGQCLTFTLGGLSKSAGLPQMKAAWVTVSGPCAEQALRRLELIADTYLSLSAPIQHALPELMRLGTSVRNQIRERTLRNCQAVHASGLRTLRVEGGWYATIAVPQSRTDEDWALRLLEMHGVLVQPGYFYDFETDRYLVISLLTPPDVFDAGLMRIRDVFEQD